MTVDYPSGTLIFEMDDEIYDMDINCSHKDLYPFVGISNSNAVVEILEWLLKKQFYKFIRFFI